MTQHDTATSRTFLKVTLQPCVKELMTIKKILMKKRKIPFFIITKLELNKVLNEPKKLVQEEGPWY